VRMAMNILMGILDPHLLRSLGESGKSQPPPSKKIFSEFIAGFGVGARPIM
jgi:hypothetical protein